MAEYELYDTIYPEKKLHPYPKERMAEILNHRQRLNNELFIDLLLSNVASIPDPSRFYPPRTPKTLLALLNEIESSPRLDIIKKTSFHYYLLLDYDASFPSPSPFAPALARRELLPDAFVRLMSGFWALDNFQFDDAVRHLAYPVVDANNADKILGVLLRHASPAHALAFYSAAQPPLDTDGAVEVYFEALLRSHVPSAFLYVRGLADAGLRERLLVKIAEYTLETGRGEVLVNLPLTEEEEVAVERVLTERGGIGEEARLVKLLHTGRLSEVVDGAKSARVRDEETGGLGWPVLAKGVGKGIGPRRAVEG